MSFILYVERISRYMKREHNKGFEEWKYKLYNNGGVFIRFQERIQRKRRRNSKGGRAKKSEAEK